MASSESATRSVRLSLRVHCSSCSVNIVTVSRQFEIRLTENLGRGRCPAEPALDAPFLWPACDLGVARRRASKLALIQRRFSFGVGMPADELDSK